jgi:hypothetical protein
VIGADRNSGLNTLTAYDGNTDYLVEGCQLNTVYKYICENTTQQIEAYRRRWKDTSLVPPFTVYVFRMRWASNTYDPKVRKYVILIYLKMKSLNSQATSITATFCPTKIMK